MKILNYSTLSLLFTTIMQAVAGYTCPNVSVINTRIAQNGSMRFPLTEGDIPAGRDLFFHYRAHNNKIEEFYTGESKTDEIIAAYYHKRTKRLEPSLTCVYKEKAGKYLLFPMSEKGARRVNGGSIKEKNSNWRIDYTGLFVCRNDGVTKENLDNCQFSIKN
jgi:hypothetical protein